MTTVLNQKLLRRRLRTTLIRTIIERTQTAVRKRLFSIFIFGAGRQIVFCYYTYESPRSTLAAPYEFRKSLCCTPPGCP